MARRRRVLLFTAAGATIAAPTTIRARNTVIARRITILPVRSALWVKPRAVAGVRSNFQVSATGQRRAPTCR
ncbi:hypothetical protein KCP75_13425 [Salmonella enterica subsp. enterica]|nr:hypothetical protein KCP75_13425 [Salmonella enterica subsp. enterica]